MPESDLVVPWAQTADFIRQLNHDLRNHLNALELTSAFLGEIVESEEAKGEVKRLREINAQMNAQLQRLSNSVSPAAPHTIRYRARDFVEDLRARLHSDSSANGDDVKWDVSLGDEMSELDPQMLVEAFTELFANARQHARGDGPLTLSAAPGNKVIVFQLREPKSKPVEITENWGGPLARCARGHYGVGLFRARNIIEAHGGTLEAHFDSAMADLVTTVTIPASVK